MPLQTGGYDAGLASCLGGLTLTHDLEMRTVLCKTLVFSFVVYSFFLLLRHVEKRFVPVMGRYLQSTCWRRSVSSKARDGGG